VVRFWDTSGIVPLLLEQEATAGVVELLAEDPDIAVWCGTSVECASAAARLRREERLTVAEEEQVLVLLDRLGEGWLEILPSEDVRRRANRLLRIHALKAADALQLAAAQIWAGESTGAELVTFDERLAAVARLEGFRVIAGRSSQ
jgi:uncharacterized protein